MKKRSATILLAILNSSQNNLNFDILCNIYKVSERTIRNDINEINDWLKENNYSLLKTNSNGYLTINNKKEINEIKNKLMSLDTYAYRLLPDERKSIIIVTLLTSKIYSIKGLCERTNASRATVLADIAYLKEENNNYLKIETVVGKGIVSKLNDNEKLKILVNLINDNMTSFTGHNVFLNIILGLIEENLSFGEVVKKLQKMNIVEKYHLSDEGFRKTAIYLYTIINKKYTFTNEVGIVDKNITNYVDEVVGAFKKYLDNKTIDEEKNRFATYLNKNCPFTNINVSNDSPEVITVVAEFLRRVSDDLNQDLYKDYVLFEFLVSHITGLVERIKNGSNEHSQEETAIKDINDKYPDIVSSVNSNIGIIEKMFDVKLSIEDKSYIVMYVQATIYRNSNDSRTNNVSIACPSSLATGQLLAAQVNKYFNYNIVDVTSVDNINNYKKEDVDFVLSTAIIPFCIWPVMIVTPVLHVTDITKIHKLAYEIYRKNKNRKVVTNTSNKQTIKKEEISLLDILDENNIEFTDEKINIIDSIRMAGNILLKNNCIEANYIERIIKALNEYGPYFVISKGAVLLHAKSNNENKKTAMSLLVCKKGVDYGVDMLDPIKLIFCFSYQDVGDYLKSLNQLVEIGKNQKVIESICQANNGRQVINIIKSHLKFAEGREL